MAGYICLNLCRKSLGLCGSQLHRTENVMMFGKVMFSNGVDITAGDADQKSKVASQAADQKSKVAGLEISMPTVVKETTGTTVHIEKVEQPIVEIKVPVVPSIIKPSLSIRIKDAVTFRAKIVDDNVLNMFKSLRLGYNELTSKVFNIDDKTTWRNSFSRLIESGITNLALALNLSGISAYNEKMIMRFFNFFRQLKVDFNQLRGSVRITSLHTTFITNSKKLGVNVGNSCSN